MARDFNGSTDDYTRESVPTSLQSVPLTLAAWIYPNSTSSVGGIIGVGGGGSGTHNNFSLIQVNAVVWATTQNDSFANATQSISSGAWQACLGRFSSNASRIAYVDGVAGTEETTSITPDTAFMDRTRIGQRSSTVTDQNFDGRIAEVAGWSVALSDEEIAAHAAGFSALLIRPSALILYVPLIRSGNDRKDNAAFTVNGTETIIEHPRIIYPRSVYLGKGTAAAPGGGIIQLNGMTGGMEQMSGGMRG